jgi:hypothetical protein
MLGASDPTPLLLAWMGPLLADFTAPTARHALVLVTGAVLAPARRTVAAALCAAGYGQAAEFTNYHRVLNRNRWSSRHVAQRLLLLLVQAFIEGVLAGKRRRRRCALHPAGTIYHPTEAGLIARPQANLDGGRCLSEPFILDGLGHRGATRLGRGFGSLPETETGEDAVRAVPLNFSHRLPSGAPSAAAVAPRSPTGRRNSRTGST